jgi:4-hydroxy-2-oxoheptanedioate aldolase
MKLNKMKAKLFAGEPAFGVSIMIPCPQIVEMIGRLGFDWVLIDCEHGTISLETVEILAMAAEASGIIPIARPKTKAPHDILNVMDRGVMGVQVPHVNTAEDARQVVEAVKYHPLGKRGLAAGTRPADYGFGESMDRFVKTSNKETLVCVQLEEAEAIHNAHEIVQVDHVDVFFIGPSDLSQSMGYPGDTKAPSVQEAIDSTFRKIISAEKIAGTPGAIDSINGVLDKGILYTYTHLTKLLGYAGQAFFKAAKQ